MVAKNAKVANGKKSGDIVIDSITTARSRSSSRYYFSTVMVD
jgi:hypothetical protein